MPLMPLQKEIIIFNSKNVLKFLEIFSLYANQS